MASVTFEKAERRYPGAPTAAVNGIDLLIEDGEFMVLVGPSGCGKSTTLRMLAGLEEVTAGRILIGDRDVTGLAPKDRDIAMVFQSYALYPHMTVFENMEFSLKVNKAPKEERERRVKSAAALLGLTDYLDRKPKALSGGQRQRVAMGRAIVREPQVFCMDEPLSNLDAKMRVQTRTDIAKLQADLGATTVYVTHDQVEAMTMGDRVAVMNAGELQQVATPMELYSRPANLFVAGFIGSPQMNLLAATVSGGLVRLGSYDVPVPATTLAKLPKDVTVGVRPEAFHVVPDGGLPVEVVVVEHLGSDSYVHGTVALGGDDSGPEDSRPEDPGRLVVRVSPRSEVARGDHLQVSVEPADIHLFDTATGRRLTA
ncbi:sn-glycerol-3-phosphate ABC transporter ATP-binding protein UgpC [Frankia sp. AgB1.9]|uniref:ABC transporter ATP-binding protein n=1 Tax=unclassified Frankia TaxID=2632575 RepID=UPI001932DFC1|nr:MULTISPECIES: sn-glycerol-3-phosphate ABC transporter ATP-binding protein UgpC [unclassified Frankia]MBL7492213.1 sn-glycerol-3-phosphate ABC transporter ATP-binding protein UgpC [Frankia sp. AgW1.1]MBL7551521.1 sn-glycerol-3-phosphate ABC transporter ATP-binding protein UgpC [Frankia sp. AgB1.9]MBL7622502.1 sn-glycerol-3-phosphate ABC transporter ATP-binding protein UgpC [Frankia sp. AgB1.8]